MPRVLPTLAEQHLTEVIRPNDLKYDGRTDLIAVITEAGIVVVYRLGGQNAFHIEADDLSGQPTCLSWARKGELLLIGTDSGLVDLLYTRTGKVTLGRERHAGRDGDLAVNGIGTHVSSIDFGNAESQSSPPSTSSKQNGTELSVKEWFEQISLDGTSTQPTTKHHQLLESLPRALATMTPSDVLPRLSAISPPSKAGPGMPTPVIRSAQRDLHILLNKRASHNLEGVEVTFVSLQNGAVDSSIGELFDHTFPSKELPEEHEFVRHCTDPHSGLHTILRCQATGDEGDVRTLSPLALDLYQVPFATSGSVHTSTILSDATQLKLLELYISQVIDTIVLDWNTLTSLPERFIANINETLEEKQEGRLEQHFYQLLLTGHCSKTVIEWLREELAERGHKRWDHAMTTFYHSVAQLLEVHLLPAIERCALTASTLRGIATYCEGSKKFDVPPSFFSRIIEAVGSIQLLTHETMQILGQEERQFRAFSSWLRNRIDIAAAEPGSTAAVELAEREAMSTDVPKILSYLEGPFIGSKLQPLIGRKLQAGEIKSKLSSVDLSTQYTGDAVKRSRHSEEAASDVLYMPIHLADLQRQVEACSAQMKRWQSTTWLPPEKIILELDIMSTSMDIVMSSTSGSSSPNPTTITVGFSEPHSPRLIVHSVSIKQESRSFSQQTTQETKTIIMEDGNEAVDVKLLPDKSILVLLATEKDHSIALIPSTKIFQNDPSADTMISGAELEALTVHQFPGDDFEPRFLYLSDNPDRRNILVLDKTRQRWKVFRLSSDIVGNRAGLVGASGDESSRQNPFGLEGNDMAID
ncbi:putative anaphase-promoting complex, cyclosome, subunit 4 [Elsinoe australis]|uniref:Anaphase-promoting complex subunit 4 n=1 Tax=Elsinoe australis TaxID=40998 RepID=A0A4U7ATY7_9PEZI|nr:putative anaphase-promoting complex, cyclosome, subunit 4 [Elsinoe australis]